MVDFFAKVSISLSGIFISGSHFFAEKKPDRSRPGIFNQ
jgi:hypothetical protein